MTDRPLRLRILNDFEIVVEGLRSMLEPFSERVRVVETEAGGTGDRTADITLYDTFGRSQVDQPDIDEVIADPTAGRVVIFSWNTQAALVAEALAKGCGGYLGKAMNANELVDRLERIAAGEIVVATGTDATGADEAVAGNTGEHDVLGIWPGKRQGLSAREAEVVVLITQGFTNPEIAARTYITVNSLKTYIRSAYRKMGVERRSQAVHWGIRHGMLPAAEPAQLGEQA